MNKAFLACAGISGAVSVTFGALGAHYLKGKVAAGLISPENLLSFQTGVNYQMYHTLALLGLALLPNTKQFRFAGILFIIGIFLFSFSIYILSLRSLYGIEGLKFLGPITPLGGLCFIAGWILIVIGAMNKVGNKQ